MAEENNETSYEDAVAKARQLHWVPKEEYKGDPAKWRDAPEFLEFGERVLPIVQENNKRLLEQNQTLQKEIAAIRVQVEKFAKVHEETSKAAYAKALEDLKAQKAEALATQDYTAVVETDEKIAATKAARDQANKEQQQQPAPVDPKIQQIYEQWAKENSDILSDPELEEFAKAEGMILSKKGEPRFGDDFRPFLDKVAQGVRARFPDRFENRNRTGASRVDGGGEGGGAATSGKHTFAQLPKEAKEAYQFLVDTGSKMTKEQYSNRYKW